MEFVYDHAGYGRKLSGEIRVSLRVSFSDCEVGGALTGYTGQQVEYDMHGLG